MSKSISHGDFCIEGFLDNVVTLACGVWAVAKIDDDYPVFDLSSDCKPTNIGKNLRGLGRDEGWSYIFDEVPVIEVYPCV